MAKDAVKQHKSSVDEKYSPLTQKGNIVGYDMFALGMTLFALKFNIKNDKLTYKEFEECLPRMLED